MIRCLSIPYCLFQSPDPLQPGCMSPGPCGKGKDDLPAFPHHRDYLRNVPMSMYSPVVPTMTCVRERRALAQTDSCSEKPDAAFKSIVRAGQRDTRLSRPRTATSLNFDRLIHFLTTVTWEHSADQVHQQSPRNLLSPAQQLFDSGSDRRNQDPSANHSNSGHSAYIE
jgi:hypothetical protein